jgi:hypothetical protein
MVPLHSTDTSIDPAHRLGLAGCWGIAPIRAEQRSIVRASYASDRAMRNAGCDDSKRPLWVYSVEKLNCATRQNITSKSRPLRMRYKRR